MKSDHQLRAEQMQLAMRGHFGDLIPALPEEKGVPEPTALDERTVAAGDVQNGARVLRLRPDRIAPSEYANRQTFNWDGKVFQGFKQEIAAACGNIVPIMVRPARRGAEVNYELVYGHRRHRACLELGLSVLAVVEELDDQQLLVQMVKENGDRRDCSPYERGVQFRRAIGRGLFPSQRKLADAIGYDNSTVGKLIKLAELPDEVVRAFRSPAKIQVKWGAALERALEADRRGVLGRAAEIAASGKPTDAKQVFDKLVPVPPEPAPVADRVIHMDRGGKTWAVITMPLAAKGEGIRVQFSPDAEVQADKLESALRQLL